MRWVLLVFALAACGAPTAPREDCVTTDTLVFTFEGRQYGQPLLWYAHGQACVDAMARHPERTRWLR